MNTDMNEYIFKKTESSQISTNENDEPEYHGGYPLTLFMQNYREENTNLGKLEGGHLESGNFKRFHNLVIPFGLIFENRNNRLHKFVVDPEDKYEERMIDDGLFDKLFYSVGEQIQTKGSNSKKTRKNKPSKK